MREQQIEGRVKGPEVTEGRFSILWQSGLWVPRKPERLTSESTSRLLACEVALGSLVPSSISLCFLGFTDLRWVS